MINFGLGMLEVISNKTRIQLIDLFSTLRLPRLFVHLDNRPFSK